MGLKWAYCRPRNAVRKWLILMLSETTKDSSFKIPQGIALDSLYIFSGSNVVYFGACLCRDFSIMLQPIL